MAVKKKKPKLPRAPIMRQTGGPMKDRRPLLREKNDRADRRQEE